MVVIECLSRELFDDPRFAEVSGAYETVGALGKASVMRKSYERLEDMKLATFFAVRDGADKLQGFGVVVFSKSLHYGKLLAYADTLFVMPEARKSGVGARLMRAMRDSSRAKGAVALVMNAPCGGVLDKLLGTLSERSRVIHAYNTYLEPL